MKEFIVPPVMTILLVACGGNSEPEKKGSGEFTRDKSGDYATAEITIQGDDVVTINLDETKEGKPKEELGDKYGMKATSKKAKREWDEQVEFLENYIEKNGLNKVEMNDIGYPMNDDVLAGCAINVKNLMNVAKNVKGNAKQNSLQKTEIPAISAFFRVNPDLSFLSATGFIVLLKLYITDVFAFFESKKFNCVYPMRRIKEDGCIYPTVCLSSQG